MSYVWTPQMLRLLRLCADGGISQRETSIYLGVSRAAIATQATLHRIKFHGGRGGRPYRDDRYRLHRLLLERQGVELP